MKRVAPQQRYAAKQETHPSLPDIIEDDPFSDCGKLEINCPVAKIVQCSDQYFTCIGEIIDISIHSASTDQFSLDFLHDDSVIITVQMLYLVPASVEDDPTGKHDWRWSGQLGPSFKVPGILVEAVNPSASTLSAGISFYLFESRLLLSVGATILERLADGARRVGESNVKASMVKMTDRFPYREATGSCPFIVCFIFSQSM